MDLSVCVGTFGGSEWIALAERAVASAKAEGVPVIHRHGETLAQARNEALALVQTDHVLFLDADDELSPGYVEAVARGTADVRVPMLRFIRGNRPRLWQPRVANHQHDCVAGCITSGEGNWVPAGTVWRTEQVRGAGGWREFEVYEDFDLAMRVLLGGASIELIRDAYYVARVRPDSRNRAPSIEFRNRIHHEIVAANLPDEAAAA